jgi:prepilin-type N-terminal cleavage/methylation domain-containing protein
MKINRQSKGLSLVEMLVVIAIILVIAAIVFPLVAKAKLSAKRTACNSNLKQAGVALSLYIEQVGDYPMTVRNYGGREPRKMRAVSAITSNFAGATRVLLCPLDDPEGRKALYHDERREPQSYKATWFLWEKDSGVEAWKQLTNLDPNPILFRCYFHIDPCRTELMANRTDFWCLMGGALVARRDTSVSVDKRRHELFIDRVDPVTGAMQGNMRKVNWYMATDVPCPASICENASDDDGIR